MNDRPRSREMNDDSRREYERESATGLPHWVWVAGIVAILLALLVVVLLLTSEGQHGPGRHSGGSEDPVPPARITEEGHRPAGGHG